MTDTLAVKFVEGSEDEIEGLGLPFGGPLNGNDLTNTRFTKATKFLLDWNTSGEYPLIIEHGFDDTLGPQVVGRATIKSWDDKGGWVKAKLDRAHEYKAQIAELVKAGALKFSSGGVDHLVEVAAKSGEIKQWPLVEFSLVTRPANPDQPTPSFKSLDDAQLAEAVKHYAVLGIAAPEEIRPAEDPPTPTPETAVKAEPEPAVKAVDPVTEPAIKAGARNSSSDAATIQSIHDAASHLGAMCPDPGEPDADDTAAGKALDTPSAPVLAIKAGDHAEQVTEADLDALRSRLSALAVTEAKRILGH